MADNFLFPENFQQDGTFDTTFDYSNFNLDASSGSLPFRNPPLFEEASYHPTEPYQPVTAHWLSTAIPSGASHIPTKVKSQHTQRAKANSTQAAIPLYEQPAHKRQRSNDYVSHQSFGPTGPQRLDTQSISTCCSSCSDGIPCGQPECSPERDDVVECNRASCSQPCNNTCDFAMGRVQEQICGDWAYVLQPQSNGQSWGGPSWGSHSTMTYYPSNSNTPNNGALPIDPQLNPRQHMQSQQLQYAQLDGSRHTTPSLGVGLTTPNSMGFASSPSFPSQDSPFNGTDNSMLSGTGTMFHSGMGSISNGESNNFSCYWDNCNTDFNDPNELHKHFHTDHLDPVLKYSCPVPSSTCPEIVGTDPVSHLQLFHGWEKNNCPDSSCQEDGPEFCDPSQLHNHFDQEHSIQPQEGLACKWQSCTAIIPGVMGLSEHLQAQHNFHITVTCDEEIDLTSAGKEAAAAAKAVPSVLPKRTSRSVNDDEASLTCEWQNDDGSICGLSWFGKDAAKELQDHIMDSHLQKLSSKTGFYCRWKDCRRETNEKLDADAKGFSQRGKLFRHMASHTGFKCCHCDICGESFSAPQALKQHIYLHTNEKPWKCRFCPKAFPQQSAKTIHERTHTGAKPLQCETCGQKFSESSNLTKHRKTHGTKGIHICSFPGCGKDFHRFDQLKRHRRSHRTAAEKKEDKARKGRIGDDDASSLCTSTFDELSTRDGSG